MIIAEHDGVRECDEYPATAPELGTFWEDNSGWLYFCYDYDHHDHAVYLMGVENKYSIDTPKHNGNDYYEELFHFDHLYQHLQLQEVHGISQILVVYEVGLCRLFQEEMVLICPGSLH